MARGRKSKQPDKIDEAVASITSNVTKEALNQFVREATAAQGEIDESAVEMAACKAVLKDVFKRAEKAGIDKEDFKWALAQNKMDADMREASHRRRMLYMEFLDKPPGTQANFDFAGAGGVGTEPENQPETMSEIQRNRITDAGKAAGREGMRADQNPWQAGSYSAQIWDTGWQSAQAEMAQKLGADAAA